MQNKSYRPFPNSTRDENPKCLNFCLPVLPVLQARGTTRWYVPAAWGASSRQLESLRFSHAKVCTFLGRSTRDYDFAGWKAGIAFFGPPSFCVRGFWARPNWANSWLYTWQEEGPAAASLRDLLYGSQGYWRKLGWRFSRNACFPSAPSSVM